MEADAEAAAPRRVMAMAEKCILFRNEVESESEERLRFSKKNERWRQKVNSGDELEKKWRVGVQTL